MRTSKPYLRRKVEVTQEDIHNGKIGSRDCCPVALAVGRQVWHPGTVRVDARQIEADNRTYSTPSAASQFVEDFDQKGKQGVKPFSFFLDFRL